MIHFGYSPRDQSLRGGQYLAFDINLRNNSVGICTSSDIIQERTRTYLSAFYTYITIMSFGHNLFAGVIKMKEKN